MSELKRGLLIFVLGMFIISLVNFSCAVSVSLSDNGDGTATVSVSSATGLYAYEVNLDYNGSISDGDFYDFLAEGSSETTSGHSEKNSISSFYESRLDATETGVSGSGELFNVSYDGAVSLRYALFINADGSEEYVYFFNQSSDDGNTGSDSGSSDSTSSGGAGSLSPAIVNNIAVDDENIVLEMVTGANRKAVITVTNNGRAAENILLSQEGLNKIVLFEESIISIGPGESKDIEITFIAPNVAGNYAGTIFFGDTDVLVSIDVRTKELLFDAMVVVPDRDKIIKLGSKLDTEITLIPMGEDGERVDVTLNYLIKDYNGRLIFSESETILVEGQKTFGKDFYTGNLPVGNYLVAVEVVYKNGVATSSAHFEVSDNPPLDLYWILVALILGILVLGVLIVAVLIRYKKKRKKFFRR